MAMKICFLCFPLETYFCAKRKKTNFISYLTDKYIYVLLRKKGLHHLKFVVAHSTDVSHSNNGCFHYFFVPFTAIYIQSYMHIYLEKRYQISRELWYIRCVYVWIYVYDWLVALSLCALVFECKVQEFHRKVNGFTINISDTFRINWEYFLSISPLPAAAVTAKLTTMIKTKIMKSSTT